MGYYIGIDLGTSSVKLIAMNQSGDILASVSEDYPLSFPQPLWSEQNPEDWYNASLRGLEKLILNLNKAEIEAISFSGQMHGLVLLDENDEVIRPAILWNDQRSTEETDYFNRSIGVDTVSEYTGNIAFPGFTAPKLLWVRNHERDHFNRISKVMLPKDYLAYRLSGVFATDYADASGTLYLDVQNKKWSESMLKLLGINESQLPKLYESYEAIGQLKPELASRLGLGSSVNIVIGTGDQAAAAVGGGIVKSGACSISLGTSGVVFVHSDQFLKDDSYGLHAFCHANGAYHLMGCMLSAAGSLKWWTEDVMKSNDFDGLLKEADQVVIDNGLYFLPYLMGERSPHNDPYARGVFWGMNLTHGRGAMTRAVLEGVTFGLRDSFEIIKNLGQPLDEIVINGGGSKSDFWCQMVADIMATPVVKLKTDAGPAYGAAILAAVGAGTFKNVSEACDTVIKKVKTYVPNPEESKAYDVKYTTFKALYPELKPLFRKYQ